MATRSPLKIRWPGWSTLKKSVSSQGGFFPLQFPGQLSHSQRMWLPGLSSFGAIQLEWYNGGYHLVFLQMSDGDVLVNRVSRLPHNAPKNQIPKKHALFRHDGEPFCALYKQKMPFWRHFSMFPQFRGSMVGLGSYTESIIWANTKELSLAAPGEGTPLFYKCVASIRAGQMLN